jgi:protein tyrosine/serine phosphatase
MRKIKTLILVSILLFSGIYVFSLSERSAYDRSLSFSREIFNFHVVAPNIMRASQPTEEAIRLLKRYCGIKTILNLRNDNSCKPEEKYVKKLGIKFINIPMDATQEQSIATIEKAIAIINDKANQPIFVHCYAGKDRTGIIFAAYRIKYNNWSMEDALMEMLVYGYDRILFPNLERSLYNWDRWRRKNNGASHRGLKWFS